MRLQPLIAALLRSNYFWINFLTRNLWLLMESDDSISPRGPKSWGMVTLLSVTHSRRDP